MASIVNDPKGWTELLEEFPVHVVALWMGHDAKVSLKHYAQTTDEHFDRAASGAESGSPNAQNAAQRGGVAIRREVTEDGANGDGVASCATPCDSSRYTEHTFSGEGGIRTLGGLSPTPVFETGTIGHSVTSPADGYYRGLPILEKATRTRFSLPRRGDSHLHILWASIQ
jgi:hypothetical protein